MHSPRAKHDQKYRLQHYQQETFEMDKNITMGACMIADFEQNHKVRTR